MGSPKGYVKYNIGIVRTLRDLGGRYQRYLHQDEFGPTRAERMAALRSLLNLHETLLERLGTLPERLRLQLSDRIARGCSRVERDSDLFQACRNDEGAVQLVAEAAADEAGVLDGASAAGDAELMDDLRGEAEKTLELLSALDTTTAVAIEAESPRLELAEGDESEPISFVIVFARIDRLRRHFELTLGSLERRKGPERCESLRWLVWELCDLYHRETGLPVTSSAVVDYFYTGRPKSPAGKFVLAAVEALQPSDAWAQEPDHRAAQRRDRTLYEGGLATAVYLAMLQYVSHRRRLTAEVGVTT